MSNKTLYALTMCLLFASAAIVSTLWLVADVVDWRHNPLWVAAPFTFGLISGSFIPRK